MHSCNPEVECKSEVFHKSVTQSKLQMSKDFAKIFYSAGCGSQRNQLLSVNGSFMQPFNAIECGIMAVLISDKSQSPTVYTRLSDYLLSRQT